MGTQETIVQRMRGQAMAIFNAGLKAVDPVEAVCLHVKIADDTLSIDDRGYDLKQFDKIFIVLTP